MVTDKYLPKAGAMLAELVEQRHRATEATTHQGTDVIAGSILEGRAHDARRLTARPVGLDPVAHLEYSNFLCGIGKYIITRNGAKLYLHDGYTFWRSTGSRCSVMWYCSSRAYGCRASLKDYDGEMMPAITEHNHEKPTMIREESASFIQMSSGATLLTYNGYTFWRNCRKNVKDSQRSWHCSSKVQAHCKVVVYCSGTRILQVKNEHNHPPPILVPVGNVVAELLPEQLPEWTPIYYVKVKDNEMKCNLCEHILKVDEKSLDLFVHMKNEHKDIYELHKDNPAATVGFRIEFLHLNMLKDDGDAKTQPVILEEVCEARTEPEPPKEIVSDVVTTKEDDLSMQYVLIDHTKKKVRRERSGQRKRSWVWKYFEKMSNIIYRCKLCNVVLSIKGCNSNNMNRHVRTRHPNVFKNEVTKLDKPENSNFIICEDDTPYAIKTEEIYASDRDYEEITDSSTKRTQKMRRSWIWSYFDRVSRTQAQCKLCKRHICHGGNATGNMNRHLKMIHHTTAYDSSWVWKVFEHTEDDFYSCKICQYRCIKYNADIDKSISCILHHLKLEHGVVSGDQIITGADVEADEN